MYSYGYILIIYNNRKRKGVFNMPNRDGTGPEGKGPKTGRGIGNCSVEEKPIDRPRGTGIGRGRGQGQGRRAQK